MLTKVYFIRHAQPDHAWQEDSTRPLTQAGLADRAIVWETLRDKDINYFYSSPYKRTLDTVAPTAEKMGLQIVTDERLREREKGPGGNEYGMFERRWGDFDYHEPGGESLRRCQRRNIEVLSEILDRHPGSGIAIGTHGTALSTIINNYIRDFGVKDFLRIIDWMPYIVELDFDGQKFEAITELAHIEKVFTGKARADKR